MYFDKLMLIYMSQASMINSLNLPLERYCPLNLSIIIVNDHKRKCTFCQGIYSCTPFERKNGTRPSLSSISIYAWNNTSNAQDHNTSSRTITKVWQHWVWPLADGWQLWNTRGYKLGCGAGVMVYVLELEIWE